MLAPLTAAAGHSSSLRPSFHPSNEDSGPALEQWLAQHRERLRAVQPER